jgi:DNA anti-recombination protein RmuC
METIVTETQDEDLNKPATIGTVRMLAVHADAGFAQLHMDLERLNDKVDHLDENLSQRIGGVETNLSQRIDSVEDKLTQRINSVEDKLTQRIDHLDEKLTQRIDNSVIELKSEMSVNLSTVMDQLALRSNSDRFIKTGFGVAVLGVLIQTVFAALR